MSELDDAGDTVSSPVGEAGGDVERRTERTWFEIGRLEHDLETLRGAVGAAEEDRAPAQTWMWGRFVFGLVCGAAASLGLGWVSHL